MKNLFRNLDEILRGRATSIQALQGGQLDIPVRELLPILFQLAAFYGFCMGWYSIFNHADPQYMQILADMLKVPLLFILTLLVTLPSLYIFNALVGSRLDMRSIVGLVIASLAVTLAVLASFGPIVAFFSLTTSSYAFIKLFNVVVFAIAAILGLTFLFRTLHRITLAMNPEETPQPRRRRKILKGALVLDAVDAAVVNGNSSTDVEIVSAMEMHTEPVREAGPLDGDQKSIPQRHVKRVFYCWVVLFALVGGQMSWVLRPFIGEPGTPFTFFRTRESNFLEAVWQALIHLLR